MGVPRHKDYGQASVSMGHTVGGNMNNGDQDEVRPQDVEPVLSEGEIGRLAKWFLTTDEGFLIREGSAVDNAIRHMEELRAKIERLEKGLEKIGDELGVPSGSYPENVYNACILVQELLEE